MVTSRFPPFRIIGRCGRIRYNQSMEFGVFHDRSAETPEAKARWFQSLPLEDRMDLLCWFTDLALSINPHLAEKKHDEQTQRGVRVLRLP